MRLWLPFLLAAILPFACSKEPAPAAPPSLTIFAAASTTDIITEAARRFEKSSHIHVTTSFAASSALAQQIKSGAPADLFLSADERWMDDLAGAGAIQPASRRDLLTNDLVFIAPKASTLSLQPSRDFNFAASFAPPMKLALADPTHVPAGHYAQQSLESLGWWTAIQGRIVTGQDVRATLRLVEMGEADAGIVYSTDAAASDKVRILFTFPDSTHEPIRYPVALTRTASPRAAEFLTFLSSPEMTAVYQSRGFRLIPTH